MEALAAPLLDNDPEIVAAKQVMAFPSGHWKLLVEYTCRTHIMIPDSPRGSTPTYITYEYMRSKSKSKPLRGVGATCSVQTRCCVRAEGSHL